MGDPGTKAELLSLGDLEATSGFRTGRKHILSILVENKPGVLTRVAGLFARRGFNIDTLVVDDLDAQIGQQGLPVRRVARELVAGLLVAHQWFLS